LRYFAWSGTKNEISIKHHFIQLCCKHITTLYITQFDVFKNYNELHKTQQTLLLLPIIATHCTQLKYLTVDFSCFLTGEALENVFISCTELRQLTLICHISGGAEYEKRLEDVCDNVSKRYKSKICLSRTFVPFYLWQ
jgi:hypothetical protein